MPRIYEYKDLTGKKVGNWLVVGLADGRYKHGGMLWLCECQCSKRTRRVKSRSALIQGKSNQSCGCKDRHKRRPYEALYNRLKYDNKWNRRARSVEFTYEQFLDFVKQIKCHYCWTPVYWTKCNLKNGSAYNLDRKDNSLSYTVANCVVCCERCNKAKREWFTYEEWYAMTKFFRSRRKVKK